MASLSPDISRATFEKDYSIEQNYPRFSSIKSPKPPSSTASEATLQISTPVNRPTSTVEPQHPSKPPRKYSNLGFGSIRDELIATKARFYTIPTCFKAAFEKTLHSDCIEKVQAGFEKFEEQTGQKRELVGYVFLVLVSLYLIFGEYAEVATNLIGFAYPAVASLKALGTPSKEDDRQWLIYWTVFGFFTFFDFFINDYYMYFPIYYVLKAAFLVYLHMPHTLGALKIYETFLKGFVEKQE